MILLYKLLIGLILIRITNPIKRIPDNLKYLYLLIIILTIMIIIIFIYQLNLQKILH